jgi:hypothetical protein
VSLAGEPERAEALAAQVSSRAAHMAEDVQPSLSVLAALSLFLAEFRGKSERLCQQ